ncbi:MAG: YihA family ribosome biogenesis GTP-binding protein, partial [Deltaproteobacteria bacterium]|nr:YihA family ribosome biogenesis GTP-binding protein [Deltaproteobacteria bacterium]
MMIRSAEFVKSAVRPSQYPPATLPEIAFAGRSNVGKSSLINTLVNRKRLVKTSATPGRTQQLNFFRINEAFYFVDFPGYGYAKVPRFLKKQWKPMVETYLSTRKTLKGVILIIDVRRIPGIDEHLLMNWLRHYHVQLLLVLTKIDKLSRTEQMKQRRNIAQELAVTEKELYLFSAKSGWGKDAVWDGILKMIDEE